MKATGTIRVVIVDDEEPARARVRRMLARHADFTVVEECDGGTHAIEAIEKERPDVVFLDVEMPDLSAFEMLERVRAERMPWIVFVTAHDDYAIRGFEVNALDFLLKPFDAERFDHTLERVRTTNRSTARLSDAQWKELIDRLAVDAAAREAQSAYIDRILLYTSGARTFLKLEDVDWIAAADNYSRLHCGRVEHLHRISLRELEARLDPRQFVRVHRSTIVNIDRVREIRPSFSGDQVLTLKDGTELKVSRRYRERLEGVG